MDIDAVIAEATAPVANEQTATSEVANEVSNQDQEATDKAEAESLKDKPDSELTPEQLDKRAKNRESHLNSKLAKMRRENRELREFKSQLEQKTSQAQPNTQQAPNANGAPVKPREADYNSFMDFLEAKDAYYEQLSDWKVEQKLAERDTKAKVNQVDSGKLSRIQELANQEQEFASNNPEYTKAVYENYSDFMTNMPRNVAEALLEADNASLALYALAKEDRLEDLADMSPSKIAMEIGKAEERGKAYLRPVNKATNASPPIQGLKGTGTAAKSLENKSVEELMKMFK